MAQPASRAICKPSDKTKTGGLTRKEGRIPGALAFLWKQIVEVVDRRIMLVDGQAMFRSAIS